MSFVDGIYLRMFLDIFYDPTTKSYSYSLVDLELTYKGDKRIFGWDDYPHEGVEENNI